MDNRVVPYYMTQTRMLQSDRYSYIQLVSYYIMPANMLQNDREYSCCPILRNANKPAETKLNSSDQWRTVSEKRLHAEESVMEVNSSGHDP